MTNTLARLQQLEIKMALRPNKSLFRLEHGGVFRPECDPLSYLLQHGVETPQGRIIGIAAPEGELDPLTTAVYEEINRIIEEAGAAREVTPYVHLG